MFIGHKADRQHLQALTRCKNDANLVGLIKLKIEELKDSLVAAENEVLIYRLQGKISVLKDFLEAINKSQEIVERK
jgi:hypothetical protein